jgi:hypothetical protein
MMGFPAGTTFTPYLALRNITARSIAVNLTLYTEQGTPMPGPVQSLRPWQALQVDMGSVLQQLGLKGFNGMLTLAVSHTGQINDIMAAAGSVDARGTYVFEVEGRAVEQRVSKQSPYWSVKDGNDTMVSLWNPSGKAEDVMVTLSYAGGSGKYHFRVHLAAYATANLDMMELIADQSPDADGNAIPRGVQEGSFVFHSATSVQTPVFLNVNVGIFNVVKGTCYWGMIWCDGFSGPLLIYPGWETGNAAWLQVNTQLDVWAEGQYSDGTTPAVTADFTSNNSSIVTVDEWYGVVTGSSAGQTYVTASADLPAPGEYQGYNPTCETLQIDDTLTGSGTINVYDPTPVISSVNPTTFVVGSATTFTINGQYLGTNCPTLQFPFAASYSLSPCTDSAVSGTVTATGTGSGDLVYTSKGYGGQGFLPAPGGSPQANGPQLSSSYPPVIPHLYFNGSEVTNTTVTTIIGQQISLSSSPGLPSGISVTSNSWTVPGSVVANYVSSDASAHVTAYTPPNTSGTVFYWFAPGNNTVTDTFKVSDGQSYTATATFKVVPPTWEQLTLSHGVVNINSTCYGSLYMVNGTCQLVANGIDVSAGVTPPAGFSGKWSWSQAITSATASLTATATGKVTSCQASGGDASTANTGAVWSDDPALSLGTAGTYNKETDADSFVTYLMFMPSGTGSIWVPLASLTWSWSGVAVNNGGSQNSGWIIQSSSSPQPSALAASPSTLSAFPQWSSNVQPVLKACLNNQVQP